MLSINDNVLTFTMEISHVLSKGGGYVRHCLSILSLDIRRPKYRYHGSESDPSSLMRWRSVSFALRDTVLIAQRRRFDDAFLRCSLRMQEDTRGRLQQYFPSYIADLSDQ